MKRWIPISLILLITALYFAGNIAWRKQQPTDYPLNRSEAYHFRTAIECWNTSGGKLYLLPLTSFRTHILNAPIPPVVTAALFSFGKHNAHRLYTLYVNLLYLLIALIFTYKIAERLSGMTAGLLAATLLSLYPAVYGMSRLYGHCDFPVVSAISFNIFCLLKADRFRDRRWSLLYGLSVGLGLLTKDIFIAFFCGPLAAAALTALRRESDRGSRLLNLGAALAVGIALAAPHYISSIVVRKVAYEIVTESTGPWYQWTNLRTYTFGLFQVLLSPPLFIAFLMGTVGYARSGLSRYEKLLAASWIAVPWLIMVFMPHKKMPFYAVPLLPGIAVVSAIGLLTVRIPFKKLLFAGLLAVSIIQYFDFSYFRGPDLEKWDMFTVNGKAVRYYTMNREVLFTRDRRGEICEKIVTALKDGRYGGAAPGRALIVIDDQHFPFLDPIALEVIGWINDLPLNTVHDSVFWALDTARTSSLFYLGTYEFASEDFFADHLESARWLADSHPAIRDRVMKELSGDKVEFRKSELTTLKNSFTRRTVLFSDGDLKGTLYHN